MADGQTYDWPKPNGCDQAATLTRFEAREAGVKQPVDMARITGLGPGGSRNR